jgi:hypothetical protein
MSVNLQDLLSPAGLRATLFPPSSRYHGIDVATLTRPDGTVVAYLRRRLCPQPEDFAILSEHVVTDTDRLDNVAAKHLNDPLLFWRLCDANRALDPRELTAVAGRRLVITLPDGVPGGTGG